jgi:hypothetical protein
VRAELSGQELRMRPGPQPHAPQGRLPVHGSKNEYRKQRPNGIATSLPAPGVGNCAQRLKQAATPVGRLDEATPNTPSAQECIKLRKLESPAWNSPRLPRQPLVSRILRIEVIDNHQSALAFQFARVLLCHLERSQWCKHRTDCSYNSAMTSNGQESTITNYHQLAGPGRACGERGWRRR